MSLERPTSKAIAYCEWETPINVVWENEKKHDTNTQTHPHL